MKRFSNYLEQKIALQWEQGRKPKPGEEPPAIRLTPGQYAELASERRDPSTFISCAGVHKVERIECHTRATGDNVILCPREDLFTECERETGVQMVSLASDLTHVPDNVGCCEVVSVGELVTAVKPGDIAFIDFFAVKQGYILANDEHYVAGGDAFAARFDPIKQEIIPLDNYVVTRRALDRFKIALTGTDRVEPPPMTLTDGIVSARSKSGTVITSAIYEEVVRVGKLTNRPRPGVMTVLERKLLDVVTRFEANEYDGVDADEAEAINAVREERMFGRHSDIKPGDLVAFCKQLSVPARVKGEFQRLIPYDNVLAVIDDAAILDDAIRAGKAGKIRLVG